MNDIEKRARELLAAEYEKGRFRAYGPEIRNGTAGATWDEEVRAIIAALTIREGELLTGGAVNLLDQQHSGVVVAQVLDVVPSAALGADEAGAVGVGGQSDQSVGVELAEVASEHEEGVLPANDGHVTRGTPQQTRQLVAFESYITEVMNRIVETGEGDPVWLNRHNAEAILAAIAPQWQPIETAPKTAGTAILGWDGYDMLVTCWCDRPHGRGGWYEREDRYETFYWEPTHWMPLPAEPGVTQ